MWFVQKRKRMLYWRENFRPLDRICLPNTRQMYFSRVFPTACSVKIVPLINIFTYKTTYLTSKHYTKIFRNFYPEGGLKTGHCIHNRRRDDDTRVECKLRNANPCFIICKAIGLWSIIWESSFLIMRRFGKWFPVEKVLFVFEWHEAIEIDLYNNK